jgi:hypothetical protein
MDGKPRHGLHANTPWTGVGIPEMSEMDDLTARETRNARRPCAVRAGKVSGRHDDSGLPYLVRLHALGCLHFVNDLAPTR